MSQPERADRSAPPPNGPGESGVRDDLAREELELRAREQAEAAAAVQAVMRNEELKAERVAKQARTERRPRRSPLKLLLLGMLLVINAEFWMRPPQWLRFNPPPAPTYAYYRDSWKVAVALERDRVEQYHRLHGALPDSLVQAGQPVRGVDYLLLPSRTYLLSAGQGAGRILYDSRDSLNALLGRSLIQMGLVAGGAR
jgi:hypothetical protein